MHYRRRINGETQAFLLSIPFVLRPVFPRPHFYSCCYERLNSTRSATLQFIQNLGFQLLPHLAALSDMFSSQLYVACVYVCDPWRFE